MYYYEENGQCFAACQPLPLTAAEDVARRSWGQVFTQLLRMAVFAA